jgi:hypothetical protein
LLLIGIAPCTGTHSTRGANYVNMLDQTRIGSLLMDTV